MAITDSTFYRHGNVGQQMYLWGRVTVKESELVLDTDHVESVRRDFLHEEDVMSGSHLTHLDQSEGTKWLYYPPEESCSSYHNFPSLCSPPALSPNINCQSPLSALLKGN